MNIYQNLIENTVILLICKHELGCYLQYYLFYKWRPTSMIRRLTSCKYLWV